MINNEIYKLRREQMQILCHEELIASRNEYYQYLERRIQMLERFQLSKVVASRPSSKIRSIFKRAK